MASLTPSPRMTGALLVISAAVVNGAFTGLSSYFDYPQVLAAPAERVLEQFTEQAVLSGPCSRCWQWAPPCSCPSRWAPRPWRGPADGRGPRR